MRLIDGDALIEKFNEKVGMEERIIDARTAERFATFCALADAVEEMPTVDAAPVVHGRWIEQEKYTFGVMYDCSICGNRILDNGHSWNYCPNCGARMDGDAERRNT